MLTLSPIRTPDMTRTAVTSSLLFWERKARHQSVSLSSPPIRQVGSPACRFERSDWLYSKYTGSGTTSTHPVGFKAKDMPGRTHHALQNHRYSSIYSGRAFCLMQSSPRLPPAPIQTQLRLYIDRHFIVWPAYHPDTICVQNTSPTGI